MARHNFNWFLCALCVISLPLTYMAFDFNEPEDLLKELMSQLLDYTGLNNSIPNHIIKEINCSDDQKGILTQCTINPNGTIVWDVRFDMYSRNMYAFANNSISLDGCQTKPPRNTSQENYTDCMTRVYANMTTYLIRDFHNKFREILQQNCSDLAKDNCVGEK